MTKSTSSFLAIIAIIAIVAAACGNAGNSTGNTDSSCSAIADFPINTVFKTASSAYLCKGDTTFGAETAVYTTRDVSIQWPERFGDNDISCLHDSLLAVIFDSKPVAINAAITDYLTHPIGFGDYELVKVDSVPVADATTCRVLSQSVRCHTVGFCESYIVYKIDCSEYRGGAHPTYSSSFLNYDIVNNNVLDFNEIFLQDSDSVILDVVKESLCEQYYADSLDELAEKSGIFTDQIYLTHNLYLTDRNFVFYYNPYDIAPWAVGPVEVNVPLYRLYDSLTPAMRKLLFK